MTKQPVDLRPNKDVPLIDQTSGEIYHIINSFRKSSNPELAKDRNKASITLADEHTYYMVAHDDFWQFPANCYYDRGPDAYFFGTHKPNLTTPLHAALECGHVRTARELINRGARIDVLDSSGRLPIECLFSTTFSKADVTSDIETMAIELLDQMYAAGMVLDLGKMQELTKAAALSRCTKTLIHLKRYNPGIFAEAMKLESKFKIDGVQTSLTLIDFILLTKGTILENKQADIVAATLADLGAASSINPTSPNTAQLRNQIYNRLANNFMHRSIEAIALGPEQCGLNLERLAKIYNANLKSDRSLNDMYNEFVNYVLFPAFLIEAGYKPWDIKQATAAENKDAAFMSLLSDGSQLSTPYFNNQKEIKNALFEIAKQVLTPRLDHLHMTQTGTSEADQQRERFHQVRQLLRPTRLSIAWHATKFNQALRPLRHKMQWHPLVPEDFIFTPNGASAPVAKIVCLTSSDDLEAESDGDHDLNGNIINPGLDHCVGRTDYDHRCCRQDAADRSHIFSIRDADNRRLSTFEIKVDPPAGTHAFRWIEVPATDSHKHHKIAVIQHQGIRDTAPPRLASDALNAFSEQLIRHSISLIEDPKQLGEIELEANQYPTIEQEIGFSPTWQHLDRVFEEYKRPGRRAMIHPRQNDEPRLYENDHMRTHRNHRDRSFDNHFIEGFSVVRRDKESKRRLPVTGEFSLFSDEAQDKARRWKESDERHDTRPLDDQARGPKFTYETQTFRSMDVQSWLRATGIMQQIHHIITSKLPKTAETLQPIWQQQEQSATIHTLSGDQRKALASGQELDASFYAPTANPASQVNAGQAELLTGARVNFRQ